jgi:23S rRNA pseudouridine1911/1915/1917 synthase
MMTSNGKPRPVWQPNTPLSFSWPVEPTEVGLSLTDYLVAKLHLPPAQVVDLIDFGSVQVDGRQVRDPQHRLAAPQSITVHLPWLGVARHYQINPHRIVFQDAFLLAYDKEPGIPSQQTPADGYNNLYAAVIRYLEPLTAHPYVALHHRLDRETSGVMVLALDRAVNVRLGRAFEQKEVSKDYLAWVKGSPAADSWEVREDIGRSAGRYRTCQRDSGKAAETAFQVYCRETDRALVWARPRTGRTHQIRLHLQWCGHPVIGDRLYGGPPAPRLFLHAYRLALTHPMTRSSLVLVAPVPTDWPQDPLPDELVSAP